ncbi:ABC transporter transmembrane domain-containing protein [Idiomarina sp. M1R2S28]|uniref:ABC transporter transmembrane domain-containing protein n=1 Tax=Idiomarina rhizosphaerae TaxID=2961572 RepID=A0A9X2G1M3_9GAMM|nr:ABC transporter transmembrane domain-containing protein [Idiomarina rhizosphaerae]MCP1338298.1 ABC transporter transmembrane domain-containing protein [Idiomarina rhizosphaerae]
MNEIFRRYAIKPLSFLKPSFGRLTLGFIMMIVTIAIQLSIPTAIAYFIDNSVKANDNNWLTIVAIIMIFVLVLHAVATALRIYLFESAGTVIVTSIRQRLYQTIISQNIAFFDRNRIGDLSNRLSVDVDILKDTMTMGLAIGLRSLITCIGGVAFLFILSPILSLLMIIIIPLSFFAARFTGKHLKEKSRVVQEELANCNQLAQENFSNIRLVHTFNQQVNSIKQYEEATERAKKVSLSSSKLLSGYQGITTFIQYMVLLITLWFGGRLVLSGDMTIGGLTSFVLYGAMVAMSATGVSWFWGEWMKAVGATERVFQLLRVNVKQDRSRGFEDSIAFRGEIEFKDVSFMYPERPDIKALDSFSLHIKEGERVALVGESGAGKSTISNLLLGFYHPNSGELLFDGVAAQKIDLDNIRKNIAVVEQEPSLFSGSIADNIRYAIPDRLVSNEEVIEAAKQANAHDFICALPKGYETDLGDRGMQLSGGQKQRIAIARALLKKAKILILDEATSALDENNENIIQTALDHLMEGCTTIIISHRPSTIERANRIIRLDRGKILIPSSVGSHENQDL